LGFWQDAAAEAEKQKADEVQLKRVATEGQRWGHRAISMDDVNQPQNGYGSKFRTLD
jgi:hypothetical protein